MDEGDPLSAPSASVRPARRAEEDLWQALSLPDGGARLPAECACCGETATSSSAVRRASDGAELLVGYCAECMAHVGRDGTRTLAVTLSSLLLAGAIGAAWPLLGVSTSLWVHLVVVAAGASLPLAFAGLVRPRAPEGHRAWGRAVTWSARELACARSDYAAALVENNPDTRLLGTTPAPWFSPWMTAGPLLGLIGSLFLHGIYHPTLRVLNLSGERFDLWLDGARVGPVEPSSVESPSAGRELRLTAGQHRLEARGEDGRMLSNVEVTLESGKAHLYAPASDEYCFWLEKRSYGRSRVQIERAPLEAEERFWALPASLDGWFTLPPEPRPGEQALSGGVVTTLRQARCARAPKSEGE